MSTTSDPLWPTLSGIYEIQSFFMEITKILPGQKQYFTVGQDITPYLEQLDIQVPEILRGEPIEWLGNGSNDTTDKDAKVISLVTPGNPAALGLTVGCIKIRRWRVCLECGWFWCRIVIKGNFLTE